MASSEWEEVKKLAMDFQRTQQMSSVQKLSERNCVDIVKRLIEMKLLDVIFTNDGKEYLTGDQLTREIENELYAAGGRVAISELVGLLNVDYSHIEAKAHQLVRTASGGEAVSLVLEQLISRDFKDALAAEIDLHLQEAGTVAVSELSKSYDLPAEFLLNLLEERLDVLVKGKLDREARVLYTHDYLARFEAKVIGVFSALTRPIALQTVVNRYGIAEKILTATLETLLSRRRILGTVSGPTFIPEVYSKTQQEYVVSFYKHNRYLDYSTLAKLGISNGRAFLEKKFGGGSGGTNSSSSELIYLNQCAVDRLLAFQIETTAEEVVASGSFAHLLDILPSVLTAADAELLIRRTLETGGNKALLEKECVLLEDGGILVSRQFLERAKEFFAEERQKRAEAALRNGHLLAYFSKTAAATKNQASFLKSAIEEKHSKGGGDTEGPSTGGKKGGKKGSGGGGGGSGNAQGREVKTKAVKKKYKTGGKGGRGGGDDDDDDDQNSSSKKSLVFMSLEEITQLLSKKLAAERKGTANRNEEMEGGGGGEEVSEALVEGVAALIAEDLQRAYEATAREVFVSASAAAAANQPKRLSFAELQKATVEAYAQILLFDKGIQVFESADLKSKLVRYLQRTLCADLVNSLLAYFAFSSTDHQQQQQQGDQQGPQSNTNEGRAKVIGRIGDAEVRDSLSRLNNSLAAAEIATFLAELEAACPRLDILLAKKKGVERRREKVLLSEHRQLLLLQLQEVGEQQSETRDPILGLHIAVMLVFQATHEAMLHTSGKLLPAILATLAPPLVPAEVYTPLKASQELVLSLVAAAKEETAKRREITEQLLRLFDEYRPKVVAYRRPKKVEGEEKEGEEAVVKVAEEEE